jgi:hypothetical protein
LGIVSPKIQVQPPEARLGAPWQSLTWVLIALALLTAGALSFDAGVIHWWIHASPLGSTRLGASPGSLTSRT